jgi:hypothetical protein
MFGPGFRHAVEVYRGASNDPDLSGLLSLFGCTEKIVPRWRRKGDLVIGQEENGDEIIRVPLHEPIHVRQAFDESLDVTRSNCP